MKRNFDIPMTDIEGKPFADGATLKNITLLALGALARGDETQTGADKLRIYSVATKVVGGGVVDLTIEELALIKERIGKAMNAFTVGRAFELLEQDAGS